MQWCSCCLSIDTWFEPPYPLTTYPPTHPHQHTLTLSTAHLWQEVPTQSLRPQDSANGGPVSWVPGLAGSNRGGVRRAQSTSQREQSERTTAAGSQGGLRLNGGVCFKIWALYEAAASAHASNSSPAPLPPHQVYTFKTPYSLSISSCRAE